MLNGGDRQWCSMVAEMDDGKVTAGQWQQKTVNIE
jgi:hypothetical protein